MFKSAELPYLITFFQMFFNDKPIDWLLEYFINTRVCNWEKDVVSKKSTEHSQRKILVYGIYIYKKNK